MNSIMRPVYVNGNKLVYDIYKIRAEFIGKVISKHITIPQKIFENLQNYTVNININGYSFTQKLVDRRIYIPYDFDGEEVIVRIEVVKCQ